MATAIYMYSGHSLQNFEFLDPSLKGDVTPQKFKKCKIRLKLTEIYFLNYAWIQRLSAKFYDGLEGPVSPLDTQQHVRIPTPG